MTESRLDGNCCRLGPLQMPSRKKHPCVGLDDQRSLLDPGECRPVLAASPRCLHPQCCALLCRQPSPLEVAPEVPLHGDSCSSGLQPARRNVNTLQHSGQIRKSIMPGPGLISHCWHLLYEGLSMRFAGCEQACTLLSSLTAWRRLTRLWAVTMLCLAALNCLTCQTALQRAWMHTAAALWIDSLLR